MMGQKLDLKRLVIGLFWDFSGVFSNTNNQFSADINVVSLQVNSIWTLNCLGLALTSQVKDSVPQDSLDFRCQSQVPGCHQYFWPRAPRYTFLGLRFCYNGSQNSGNALVTFPELHRNSQLEEMHRTRNGGWRRHRSSESLWGHQLLSTLVYSPT